MLCPCCSGLDFSACCEPIITAKSPAATPQALMRSRYSATVHQAIDHIYNSYADSSKVHQSKQDIKQWAQSVRFIKLEILFADAPNVTANANQGTVEFIATYLEQNNCHKLHERSRFIKEQGNWRYVDGTITPHQPQSLSRNDPCPCDSGKKYKKCHGC